MPRNYKKFNWIEEESSEEYKLLLESHPNSKFVWLDANGNEHEIEYMDTAHMFYTTRMIWNYLSEDEFIIGRKIDYDFSEEPIYCDAYFKLGLKLLLEELNSREDIDKSFIRQIEFIKENLKQGLEG